MKHAKVMLKITVLMLTLFYLLPFSFYSIAADSISSENDKGSDKNVSSHSYTDKSYVFDLDDLESDEIKELYDLKEEDIPSKYNLKDEIVIYVEDQGTWELCDLFASMKSIETNYALRTGNSVDLSERYMDYISSNLLYGNRELESTNNGTTMLFASKYGVPSESAITKEYYSDLSVITNATPICRVVSTIDFKELDKTNTTNLKLLNIIKQHILKYGSLSVGVCSPDQAIGAYHNGNDAYYYKEGIIDVILRPNHQVSIVGWDDNYSKDNFNERPEMDGAFICLNSWGENWGQNGYFYVSYDTLSEFEALHGVIDTQDCIPENEYTYAEGFYTAGDVMWTNRIDKYYGVVYDTKTQGEYLTHLALALTSNPAKIKLYCNPYDGEFDSSKYIYLGETTIGFWGETLMNWENPIELKGDQFALVFEVNYDEEMNDDFINNNPSLTHDTYEIIRGHFYNSSSLDSGFELLDYDLQLYVYTTNIEPAAQTPSDFDQNEQQENNEQIGQEKEASTSRENDEKINTESDHNTFLMIVIGIILFLIIVLGFTMVILKKSRNK